MTQMTRIVPRPVTFGAVRQLTWNVVRVSSFGDTVGVQRNLWNRWICPGFNSVSPDIQFWQIVKYSFLCNAPSASWPTKIKTIKQTAITPCGVISAAVDGCSAADMPVNHNRNSLKHPHDIDSEAAPAVWQERLLTFCISPHQRQIVQQRPLARIVLSLAHT